jgi:hypothetical protein
VTMLLPVNTNTQNLSFLLNAFGQGTTLLFESDTWS